MFDSLDDQMRQDDKAVTSRKERLLRYVAVLVLSVLVFAGLYFSVRMLQ